jgi:hypothetical protein
VSLSSYSSGETAGSTSSSSDSSTDTGTSTTTTPAVDSDGDGYPDDAYAPGADQTPDPAPGDKTP